MQSFIVAKFMKLRIFIVMLYAFSLTLPLNAQFLRLSGEVTDEHRHALSGATVQLVQLQKGTVTDRKGNFTFEGLAAGIYELRVSFLGYFVFSDTVQLAENRQIRVMLLPNNHLLSELTIIEDAHHHDSKATLPVDVIDKAYLHHQLSGSLMQTLNRLPGIGSMDIGASQSKPVIRGLGFNRVVVAENGVKHEAQEWGADHGLEIDQFNVERIEILKGPASLLYGANAMGGVIDMKQIATPARNTQGGDVLLNAHTNNELLGAAAKFYKRYQYFYFKTFFSYTDFSDYRVPADSIDYMSYYFKLHNNRMRNTAGRERSGSVTLGYLNGNFSSHLTVSDYFSKSGFFANAHGLEIRNSAVDYDQSERDIDLPSQQVNHFKVLSNSIWMIKDYKLNIDVGYQNNFRQEFSEAVAHGFMPIPPDSLERQYMKNTWNTNLKLEFPIHSSHQLITGLSTEWQQNNTGGWGFMLPDFSTKTAGAFVFDHIRMNGIWSANIGLRFDAGRLATDNYFDWYTTPQPDGSEVRVQRAINLTRNYSSYSWGVGIVRDTEKMTWRMNIGKSFRMPTAKELASNGINYHMYRYEKGDTTLRAEESFQLDMGWTWKGEKWHVELTPFVNYFPNYIYLNPTSSYFEAQQIYYHSQSEVFRTGGEMLVTYALSPQLSFSTDVEYIYSLQLSGAKKGYTLPFSPPATANLGLNYSPLTRGIWQKPSMGFTLKLAGSQGQIVPPEKTTPGYVLLSLQAGTGIKMANRVVELNLRLNNVFDKRYYDHTSFYRLIEVPGQGRNLIATLQMPF